MIGQTKTLSATPALILVPGPVANIARIENNGANPVRLTIDGGQDSNFGVNPATGQPYTGTDPTPTSGILLKAGAVLQINYGNGVSRNPVYACLDSTAGGGTVIDLITDDPISTAPTP